MSIRSKDFNKMMTLVDDMDDQQFIDLAVRYMRVNDRKKVNYMCGQDGKTVEEIKVTRKLTQEDGES